MNYTPVHNHLHGQATYVEDVTEVPAEGQIIEFRVFGTAVRGVVTHSSLMVVGDETLIHVQANRIKD